MANQGALPASQTPGLDFLVRSFGPALGHCAIVVREKAGTE